MRNLNHPNHRNHLRLHHLNHLNQTFADQPVKKGELSPGSTLNDTAKAQKGQSLSWTHVFCLLPDLYFYPIFVAYAGA